MFSSCLAADSPTKPKKRELTAEQAKDALVRFIRGHRTIFIGDPAPDKLAQCPITPLGKGRYSFGAFTIDVANHSYDAVIGIQGPAPYFYNGRFTEEDRVWTATTPTIEHALGFHKVSK